jgi:hypothetical protein
MDTPQKQLIYGVARLTPAEMGKADQMAMAAGVSGHDDGGRRPRRRRGCIGTLVEASRGGSMRTGRHWRRRLARLTTSRARARSLGRPIPRLQQDSYPHPADDPHTGPEDAPALSSIARGYSCDPRQPGSDPTRRLHMFS